MRVVTSRNRWNRGGQYYHGIRWESPKKRRDGTPKRVDTYCGLTFYEGWVTDLPGYNCPRCP